MLLNPLQISSTSFYLNTEVWIITPAAGIYSCIHFHENEFNLSIPWHESDQHLSVSLELSSHYIFI